MKEILKKPIALGITILTVWELSRLAFSREIKDQIRQEQNGCCAACGKKCKTQIHHIIPQGMGGSDERVNGVGLCADCHKIWDEHAREGIIYPGISIQEAKPEMWKNGKKNNGNKNHTKASTLAFFILNVVKVLLCDIMEYVSLPNL